MGENYDRIKLKNTEIANKINMKNTHINVEKNNEVSAGVELGVNNGFNEVNININTEKVSDTKCKKYIFLEECDKAEIELGY